MRTPFYSPCTCGDFTPRIVNYKTPASRWVPHLTIKRASVVCGSCGRNPPAGVGPMSLFPDDGRKAKRLDEVYLSNMHRQALGAMNRGMTTLDREYLALQQHDSWKLLR